MIMMTWRIGVLAAIARGPSVAYAMRAGRAAMTRIAVLSDKMRLSGMDNLPHSAAQQAKLEK
jgi:hypothetical protein